jgi:ubiquinone biosynthesis protein COQ9
MELDAVRHDILMEMLTNVVFDGWTDRALKDAAMMAGLDAETARGAFPGGVPEVIAYFSAWADQQMRAQLDEDAQATAALPLRRRLARALQARFQALEPHKEAVRRTLAVLALPQYAPLGARLLSHTVDEVWKAAGDTATDFSHYTRRGLLAGVLSAATIYWLSDRSENHAATWSFIDRRLGDVLAVDRTLGRAAWLGGVAEAPFHLIGAVRGRMERRRERRGRSSGQAGGAAGSD